jgi:hypothetical protein
VPSWAALLALVLTTSVSIFFAVFDGSMQALNPPASYYTSSRSSEYVRYNNTCSMGTSLLVHTKCQKPSANAEFSKQRIHSFE